MHPTVKPRYNAIVQKALSRNRNYFRRWTHQWDNPSQIGPKFFQLFCVLSKDFMDCAA